MCRASHRLGRQQRLRLIREGGILDDWLDLAVHDAPPLVHIGEDFQIGAHRKPKGLAAADFPFGEPAW